MVYQVRQQQAAAKAAAAKQEQSLRLMQQQPQQPPPQQTRRIPSVREHARLNAHQQAQQLDVLQQRQQRVVGNNMIQQQSLHLQLPQTSSGANTPGSVATVALPNQYISPESAVTNDQGVAGVSRNPRVPSGDASFQQAAANTWGNAVQRVQGVDAAAQAAVNVMASSATIPRPGQSHLAPQGMVGGVSSGMVMPVGQPSVSSQNDLDAEERAKQQQRRLETGYIFVRLPNRTCLNDRSRLF